MAASYRVTTQRPVMMLNNGGTFEDGYEITFQSVKNGTVGRVRVPSSQYTPTQVDAIISGQVEILDAVHDL